MIVKIFSSAIKWKKVRLFVLVKKDSFLSSIYNYTFFDLILAVDDYSRILLDNNIDNPILNNLIENIIGNFFKSLPWENNIYISSKIVKSEPLLNVLERYGFKILEYRRIFICKIGDLKPLKSLSFSGIEFTTLDTVNDVLIDTYKKQIFDICKGTFGVKGYGRQFTDSFLRSRLSGFSYILSAMDLNFQILPKNQFLVAIDSNKNEIIGFSIIGSKDGLNKKTYSQLLSAVRKDYQGHGIYRGLSSLLYNSFPHDATLLNVTHTENHKIQRAYQDSGRLHLSDTVILGRNF